jgi:hypothetical protein
MPSIIKILFAMSALAIIAIAAENDPNTFSNYHDIPI